VTGDHDLGDISRLAIAASSSLLGAGVHPQEAVAAVDDALGFAGEELGANIPDVRSRISEVGGKGKRERSGDSWRAWLAIHRVMLRPQVAGRGSCEPSPEARSGWLLPQDGMRPERVGFFPQRVEAIFRCAGDFPAHAATITARVGMISACAGTIPARGEIVVMPRRGRPGARWKHCCARRNCSNVRGKQPDVR
jgi:hypothetical protein